MIHWEPKELTEGRVCQIVIHEEPKGPTLGKVSQIVTHRDSMPRGQRGAHHGKRCQIVIHCKPKGLMKAKGLPDRDP